MDIKIKSDEGNFKFRVCGILKVNNKYLTVKIGNNDFYCLPGGHVELGEDTDQAILREMKEELGYAVKIEKLVGIFQNFFEGEGKHYHEIGYYYIVTPENINDVNLNNYSIVEMDKNGPVNLEFKWFSLEELQNARFEPEVLKSNLTNTTLCSKIIRD